jgi:hypothetical protein
VPNTPVNYHLRKTVVYILYLHTENVTCNKCPMILLLFFYVVKIGQDTARITNLFLE